MEFAEQRCEQWWLGCASVVGESVVRGGEQTPCEILPAKGWSHTDSQVCRPLADVPGHMRAPGRGDDHIAGAGCLLAAVDPKANDAGNHLPTLFDLGVDVFSDAMVRPRPETR